jgi:hypothetical protein
MLLSWSSITSALEFFVCALFLRVQELRARSLCHVRGEGESIFQAGSTQLQSLRQASSSFGGMLPAKGAASSEPFPVPCKPARGSSSSSGPTSTTCDPDLLASSSCGHTSQDHKQQQKQQQDSQKSVPDEQLSQQQQEASGALRQATMHKNAAMCRKSQFLYKGSALRTYVSIKVKVPDSVKTDLGRLQTAFSGSGKIKFHWHVLMHAVIPKSLALACMPACVKTLTTLRL